MVENFNDGIVNEVLVKEGDDEKEVREYLESQNLEYPKEYVKELIKDSGKIIYELKYKYNRPRPIQVAKFYQIEGFETTTLDSMHTPSYPSGHSVQGILVGRALGKMFKEHKQELYEVGKMISDSRLMEEPLPK